MANNEIVAWLRLRDLSRFRRDAKRAEDSIKDIGDAGKDSQGPLNQLGEALSNLGAESKGAFGRTRIFGFAIGTVITALLAAIPLVIGLGGALTAVAGSAGAAALGLGALGVGFAGAGLALGAFALVAAQGVSDFTKVNTAFQQWQKQVGAYGRNSTQAETALQNLNGILRVMGGPSGTILDAVMAWDKFTKGFRRANSGTMKIIFQIMLDLIKAATKFTGTFAYMAQTVAGAVRGSFKRFLDVMTSSGIQGIFRGLADTFARLSGPLTTAFINFFVTLLRLANRIGPALVWVANGLARMSQKFKEWVGGANLGSLLSQLGSWWRLAKAIVRLMLTIFGAGAKEGQGLVDSLTRIVDKWNEWLSSVKGQKSLQSFFHDSAEMTKAFLSLLGKTIAFIFKVGRALLPTYTKIFNAIQDGAHQFFDALKPAKPFWDNVLKPLLKGIITGVGTGVVGAFKVAIFVTKTLASVLGFLGRLLSPLKSAFEFVGKVLGFVFGGAILKVLSKLGKLTVLLKPLGLLFKVLSWPIRLVGRAVEYVLGKIGSLIGSFGRLVGNIIPGVKKGFEAVIRFVFSLGDRFWRAGKWLWNTLAKGLVNAIGSGFGFAIDIAKAIANAVIDLLNDAIPNSIPIPAAPDIDLPNNPIPKLASGGIVSGSGSWITGEAGPEINTLRNGRVSVVPLSPAISAQSSNASIEPGDGQKRIVISKVYLRGRQIAEAVADEADDDAARK